MADDDLDTGQMVILNLSPAAKPAFLISASMVGPDTVNAFYTLAIARSMA
jgi:hypothetical protein